MKKKPASEPVPSVVALYGAEQEKELEGRRESIIPFVGTDGVGAAATLGVGVMRQVGGQVIISGGSPRQLIRSWRAYQLFMHVPGIPDLRQTLSACWEITAPERNLDRDPHFGHLAELFGGTMGVSEARVRIPPVFQLEDMVEILRGGSVFVDPKEFEAEVVARRLTSTPRLNRLIARLHQDRLDHHQEQGSRPVSTDDAH